MISNSCITIETNKFPILDGEEEELTNEGMYGKAFCIYLDKELPKKGIEAPFYCNEDWGWWFEVIDGDFKMALCIYCELDSGDQPYKYTIMPSIHKKKIWSWSKFRKIDVSNNVLKIVKKLESIFGQESEIKNVQRHNDYRYE